MSESTTLLARLSVLRVLLAQNYPEHHKTVLDAERALASAPQASQPPQGAELPLSVQFSADYLRAYMEGEPQEARRHLDKLIAAIAAPPQGASSLHECVRRFLNTDRLDNTTLGQFVKEASELLAASPLPAPQEPARPDILEKLTYHQHERDDLTLDECWEVLASGYRKVHGRTDRQMVMQILALLAAAPATDSTP